MARRRMIDPNFWDSEDVSRLTIMERLLLIGLFSNADDYGKGRGKSITIRSKIFPNDDLSIKVVDAALENIKKNINIIFYEVDGNLYYKFTNWCSWQRVDKPQISMIPEPSQTKQEFSQESIAIQSRIVQDLITNDSTNESKNESKNHSLLKEDKLREEKLKEGDFKNDSVADQTPKNDRALHKPRTVQCTQTEKPTKKQLYPKIEIAPSVFITEDEMDKLSSAHGTDGRNWMIKKLSDYKVSNGKTYKSDYAAINSWVVDSWNDYRQKNRPKANALERYEAF